MFNSAYLLKKFLDSIIFFNKSVSTSYIKSRLSSADLVKPLYLNFFSYFSTMNFVIRITLFPPAPVFLGVMNIIFINNNLILCYAKIRGSILFAIFTMYTVHANKLTSSLLIKIFKFKFTHFYNITIFYAHVF